jgi:putative membrane protein
MTEDQAVGAPERLHPWFLLTGIGGALRGMAGAYAVIAYLAVRGQLGTALFAAVALLVILGTGLFLYWRRFEYRVGEEEIRIDSGIFSRTHRSIPFERIHDVAITQGPVARLLGIAKVKFETGGGAGASDEEGSLQAIALERAQQIRASIRARRGAAEPAAADLAEDDRPPVFAMDLSRLLLAGLFNFSLAVFAGLFGLSQTFGDVFGFDPLRRDFWAPLLSEDHPVTGFVLSNRAAAAFAGLALLVLVGVFTGLTRTLLRDYGFRLGRTGTGLRRRRGLLTRSDVTLRAARAQAAILISGPVRSAFGWSELKIQSLAADEGGKGDHVLAPLARSEEIDTILEKLGWRPLPDGAEWKRVSSAYVWTFGLFLLPLSLLALAQMVLTLVPALIAQAAILLALLMRFVAWRRTRYAHEDDRLLIRTGWWRRRLLILPVKRIQSVDLKQNFVSRWFGAASLVFGVAGGGGFSAHLLPALPAEKASQLRKLLLSSAA